MNYELLLTVVHQCRSAVFVRLLPLRATWMARSYRPYLWQAHLTARTGTSEDTRPDHFHNLLMALAELDQYEHFFEVSRLPGYRVERRTMNEAYARLVPPSVPRRVPHTYCTPYTDMILIAVLVLCLGTILVTTIDCRIGCNVI